MDEAPIMPPTVRISLQVTYDLQEAVPGDSGSCSQTPRHLVRVGAAPVASYSGLTYSHHMPTSATDSNGCIAEAESCESDEIAVKASCDAPLYKIGSPQSSGESHRWTKAFAWYRRLQFYLIRQVGSAGYTCCGVLGDGLLLPHMPGFAFLCCTSSACMLTAFKSCKPEILSRRRWTS